MRAVSVSELNSVKHDKGGRVFARKYLTTVARKLAE